MNTIGGFDQGWYSDPSAKSLPKGVYAVHVCMKSEDTGKRSNYTVTSDDRDAVLNLAKRCHDDKIGKVKLMYSRCTWVELDIDELPKGAQKTVAFMKEGLNA